MGPSSLIACNGDGSWNLSSLCGKREKSFSFSHAPLYLFVHIYNAKNGLHLNNCPIWRTKMKSYKLNEMQMNHGMGNEDP